MADADAELDFPRERLNRFLQEQLGPACVLAFSQEARIQELQASLADGRDLEDAALAIVHRLSGEDRAIADEFLGHFLDAMMRIGSFSVSIGLRRFLDTGDLVNSVAGALWQDLQAIEFRSRREFLAYLGKRLEWKAADRARGLSAGRRREDLHREVDFADAPPAQEGQDGPATMVVKEEEFDRLALALLRLPPRDRELLTRHLRGENHAAVAEALDLSPEAARKALQRAIVKARAMLEG